MGRSQLTNMSKVITINLITDSTNCVLYIHSFPKLFVSILYINICKNKQTFKFCFHDLDLKGISQKCLLTLCDSIK